MPEISYSVLKIERNIMNIINQDILRAKINDQQKELTKLIDDRIQKSIKDELFDLFGYNLENVDGEYKSVPRLVTSLIQDKILAHAEVSLTSEKISKIIEDRFQAILEEETEKAMRKAALHMANKAAFASRNQRNQAETQDSPFRKVNIRSQENINKSFMHTYENLDPNTQ